MGDCRAAAASPIRPDTRLAVAWCALRAGDAERALTALPTPAGPLAGYEHRIRGEALLALGRAPEAVAALRQASGSGVALALGKARLASGDRAGITDLLALGDNPEALLALGDAAGMDPFVAWTRVWVDARPGGFDTQAATRLAASGTPVPNLANLDDRKLAFQRYEGLAAHGRVEEAVDLLGAIRAAGGKFDATTWARANLAARRYAAALDGWKEALGPPDSAAGAPGELFDYALTFARSGDYDTAAGLYRRLMALHPATDQAAFAGFKLGYMEYDRNRCDAAIPLLHEHVASRPQSPRAAEALWFAARCSWRAKQVDRATQDWTDLVARYPRSEFAAGAAYWLATARDDRAALQRVLDQWPETSWGWFASTRLGTRYPAKSAGAPPAWPPALATRPEVSRAAALLAQGFRAWAREELAAVSTSDRDGALALGHARLAAGDYRGATAAAKPWCGEAASNAVVRELCIPRPERAIVEPLALAAGLPPGLPYAIMTAESNLDPTVTSPAGARGLMQLMPALGVALHPELYPDRAYDPDDLYRGPYNASLGTTELASLQRRVGSRLLTSGLPAVIAGYNGGADAVTRWTAAPPVAFDAFAEDISFTETRAYVRRVLGTLQRYRIAWGDPVSP